MSTSSRSATKKRRKRSSRSSLPPQRSSRHSRKFQRVASVQSRMKRTRVFEISLDYLCKILGISSFDFERQLTSIILLVTILAVVGLLIFYIILELTFYAEDIVNAAKRGRFHDRWINLAVGFGCILTLFFNVFIFRLFRKIQVLLFVLNVVLNVVVIYFHFWMCKGIGVYEGSPVMILFVPIVTSYYFGTVVHFLFWCTVSIVVVLGTFIKEMILTSAEKIFRYYHRRDNELVFQNQTFTYFCIGCVVVVATITFFSEMFRRSHREKIVQRIGDCMLNLRFNDKFVKNFERKNKRLCSNVDRLFIGVIHNLKIIQSYLPDAIRMQSIEVEMDEPVESVESGIGSDDDIGTVEFGSDSGSIATTKSFVSTCTVSTENDQCQARCMDYSLKTLHHTVLVLFKINNMTDILNSKDIPETETFCVDYMQMIAKTVYQKRGAVSDISSDFTRILVSYGALAASWKNSKKAVDTSVMVRDWMRLEYPTAQVSALVVKSVNPVLGNVQSEFCSQFLILGNHSKALREMQKIRKTNAVIVCYKIFRDLKDDYEFKQIDFIDSLKCKIYQTDGNVLNENKRGSEEWIYQVGDSVGVEETRKVLTFKFNMIWSYYLDGDFSRARKMLLELQRDHPEDEDILYLLKKVEENSK